MLQIIKRIAQEPPLRLLSYFLVKRFSKDLRTIDRWGAVDRPHYLAGVVAAAEQAQREGTTEVSVFEFGVAGGGGLVALQAYAALVEKATNVKIRVYGFDTGEGLPELCGDYRDHPDQWRPSDYRMDIPLLQSRLTSRTSLRLGRIAETLPKLVAEGPPPTGFISCDVDLYSSTKEVLKIFTIPGRKMLRRVAIYFDDIDFYFNHRFAGELLAVEEFNQSSESVKIDIWRGIWRGRVFQEERWFEKMYLAHDLEAINSCSLRRPPSNDCRLDPN